METYHEMMPSDLDLYSILESNNQDLTDLSLYNAAHAVENTAEPNALSLNQPTACCTNRTSEDSIQNLEDSIKTISSNSTVSTSSDSSCEEISDFVSDVYNQEENQDSEANHNDVEWDKTESLGQNILNNNMVTGPTPAECGFNEMGLQTSAQETGIQRPSMEQGHTMTYPNMTIPHMVWDEQQPFGSHTFNNNLVTGPLLTQGGFNGTLLQNSVQEAGIRGSSTKQGHTVTYPDMTTPHLGWDKIPFFGQHTLHNNLVTHTAVTKEGSNEMGLQNSVPVAEIPGPSTATQRTAFSPTERAQMNNVQFDTPQLFDQHTTNSHMTGLALAEAMFNELVKNNSLTNTRINHGPTDSQSYSSAYPGMAKSSEFRRKRKRKVYNKDTEEYRKMREKNNTATRKSRLKAQIRHQEETRRMNDLELENLELSQKNHELQAKLNVFTYLCSIGYYAVRSVPRSMNAFNELQKKH